MTYPIYQTYYIDENEPESTIEYARDDSYSEDEDYL